MIIKPIDDWIRIWEKINDLTKIYQSSIIGKTLNFLESLENKKLEMIKEGYQLIDFLSQNDFNLEEAIKFLNKIKYVYNWDSFLKNFAML